MKEMLRDLKRLVDIPSVKGESEAGAPFGRPIQQALEETLGICEERGLKVTMDPEGYYGYAEIGEGELFGVLAHLDVVGVGNRSEWTHDPFDMTEEEGVIYGRGVQDDKGPMLLVLHALLSLLKEGKSLTRRVRFIFGTDEENQWECINRYKKNGEEIPSMGFTPDSAFPLIYAEKGLWQFHLTGKPGGEIVYRGGVAMNVVPGEAHYNRPPVKLKPTLEELGIKTEVRGEDLVIMGKNAHAASAQKGINAISYLLTALHRLGIKSEAARFVSDYVFDGVSGSKVFKTHEDEQSGPMTMNLALVDLDHEKERLSFDIRYPVSLKLEELETEMKNLAKTYGFTYERYDHLGPIYMDRDSELILKLMRAYSEVTGDTESKPMVSGGATYARAMDNCVAFGMVLPTSEKTEHQPNERVKIEDLKVAFDIYKKALEDLVF